MPKRSGSPFTRSDSDSSTEQQRKYAQEIALAEFRAERSSKKLKTNLNEAQKAANAKRRAKLTQMKNDAKAKLYAEEAKAKENKEAKRELEKRPFGFTRSMRSYSDKSVDSKGSVSSLDSQVLFF